MPRALAPALAACLALGLSACGSSTTADPTVTSPSVAPSSAGTGSTGSPSGTPTGTAPSATASVPTCPIKPQQVPPPADISKELTKKPVVPAHTAPPPKDVTVADVVVGTGAVATTLSMVEAKYVGALYDSGKDFDSSWKTSPQTTIPFTVCSQGTIPGFSIAPTGMKVGGRRVVTIPAAYGYREKGSPPVIPPNAVLVFVIDLVKVTPPAAG